MKTQSAHGNVGSPTDQRCSSYYPRVSVPRITAIIGWLKKQGLASSPNKTKPPAACESKNPISRKIRMLSLRVVLATGIGSICATSNAADLYWRTDGTSGTWTGANWSNPATPTGGTGWTSSNASHAFFTANSAVTFATTRVGDVTANPNVLVQITAGGTYNSGNRVATLNVGSGAVLDFSSQSFSDSTTTSKTGFIKEGQGTVYFRGTGAYVGGFTLNNGTVVIGGNSVNNLGAGALIFNGGTLMSDANFAPGAKYSSITVGGNFTIGGVTTGVPSGNGSATANITFSDAVSLGAVTRTVTIGANGTYAFNGVVSGSSGTGLTVAASGGATGSLVLGGANTYTGATTINSGTLKLGASGSISSDSALVISDGGRFDSSATTFSIGTAGLTIGVGASTSGFLNAGNITLSNGLTLSMGTLTPAASYNLWDFSSKSGNFGTVSLAGNFSGSLIRVDDLWSGTMGGYSFSLNETSGLFTVVEAAGPSYWTANGASLGGTGTWNTVGSNWSSDNTTISGAAWNSANTAVFAGTAGTVTVDGVSANAGLTFSTSGYLLSSGTLTLGAASDVANAITTESGVSATISSVLAGSNGMTKAGSGTLILSGLNTYTGGTNVNAGTLEGSTTSLQGNIVNNAAVVFNQTTNGTYSGIMSGLGSLTKNGSGTLTLSGANTYSGVTTINAGTLALGANNVIGDSSAVTIAGGTLAIGSRNETLHSINLNAGGVTLGSGTLALANASSFTGGTVTLAGSMDSRLNTTGATTLGNVNFVFNHTSNLADSDGLNIGGTVIVGNGTTANFSNAAAGLGRIELTSNTVIDVGDGAAMNVAWVVDQFGGTRSITKNGSGTLALSAANSFAGSTTINAGTLQASAVNALGSTTSLIVNSGGSLLVTAGNSVNDAASITLAGGTLSLAGTLDETLGALTLTADSIIDLDGFNGTLTFASLGAWTNNATLAITNWNGVNKYGTPVGSGIADRHVVFTDTSNLGSYLNRISFYSGDFGNGFAGTAFEMMGGEIGPVPEPEAIVTAVILLLGFGIYWVRRQSQQNRSE